jgi:hypothetical protein
VAFADVDDRIQAIHLLESKFRGDTISLEVLRDGKVVPLRMKLENPYLTIPPKPERLTYFIVAGLVFLPASLELLNSRFLIRRYGEWSVPPHLRILEMLKESEDEEVVLLNNILRHEINVGYSLGDVYRYGARVGALAPLEGCYV